MASRASEVELGLYEDRRWTDLPSHYVERALARELYERRGISRPGAQPAVTLPARSPIADGDPASVARAMGVAFDDCAAQIVSAVEAVLPHTG